MKPTPTPSTLPAERPDVSREDTVSGIVRSLNRASHGKLNGVERLVNSPAGRVFSPRSSYGPVLFQRFVTVDAVYARCEQQVIRRTSSPETFEAKVALERRMFELSAFLIEFVADMALTYQVADSVRDPVIEEAIARMRAERDGARPKKRSARAGGTRESADDIGEPVDPDPGVQAPEGVVELAS